MAKELGQRLRAERQKRSWSQEQLAQATDLSLRTVQRVERNGRCAPETLLALAAVFNLDIEELTVLRATTPQSLVGLWVERLAGFAPTFLAAFTMLLVAIFGLFTALFPQDTFWVSVVKWSIIAFVLAEGAFTVWYKIKKPLHEIWQWLLLAGALLLTAIGAAGAVWTAHLGMVTGDYEYYGFVINLLFVAQGTATVFFVGMKKPVSI